MKKILICLLLSLCMLCSLCVTAAAEGEVTDASVPSEGAEEGDLITADAADEVSEKYDNMGGAFSPERLALAGQMVLEGLGLVFLALATLWGVLVIFRHVMYDVPQKRVAAKAAQSPVEVPAVPDAPAAEPAVADEGALVAAITAAIAATIVSDEALSAEFKDGFRVVSFKKKNGGAAWNR